MVARYLAIGAMAVAFLAGCSSGTPSASSSSSASAAPSASPSEATGSQTSGVGSPTPSRLLPSTKPPASPKAGTVLTGTVVKSEVEGGCLGLNADNGKTYQILGTADRDVLVPGARVRVTGRVRDDVATICQIGTPFEVASAERL
ncbi:hypothetical protein HDA40_005692 [Hamadaea flava]|uniref:Uncharacterized protein n=1 Tax=Hamadaea flava TaxID=1742688 RepID=A0ABV8LSI4_9ACTN|nr:hypothetical protein [Hamadaea flava]MCP2327185.1 hypothetical protein [Hamadaea flava]